MKITISYLENNVEITNDFINVLEIENKKVFFRLINDLNQICNGNVIEEIKAFSDDKEINITNKVNVISDFFNIDFSRYMLLINKLINENLKDNSDKSLLLLYKKLIQKYNNIISTVDLPIAVNNDATIESLTKLFKLKVNYKSSIIENLELIKNLLLVPMLLSVFVIDYKKQIIPNRLNLTMFEVGLVIAFLYGFSNVAITIDMLFGMLIGGGIFLIITLIGRLIYGKEAMGFGDVKFMAALGLYFGFVNTALISLTSFLLGAIIGIILIVFKVKKSNEYMPFGPFIVMAALICIFVPSEILLNVLKTIFTLGISK